MRRLIPLLALATLVAALSVGPATVASAGGGAHCAPEFTDAETDVVRLSNNCFVPTIARVEQGANVRFVNEDHAPHTVTGAVYIFGDMDEFSTGERNFSFDEEGIYPYVCILHPGMAGAIVVGDGKGKITTSSVSSGAVSDFDDTSAVSEPVEETAVEQPETRPVAADTGNNLLLLAAIVLAMAGSMWWLRRKPRTEV